MTQVHLSHWHGKVLVTPHRQTNNQYQSFVWQAHAFFALTRAHQLAGVHPVVLSAGHEPPELGEAPAVRQVVLVAVPQVPSTFSRKYYRNNAGLEIDHYRSRSLSAIGNIDHFFFINYRNRYQKKVIDYQDRY